PLAPTTADRPPPVPFTPDELWRLCGDPVPDLVDGATVILYCIGALLEDCQAYLSSIHRRILPAHNPIVPHPLTFLLLHSNLVHFLNHEVITTAASATDAISSLDRNDDVVVAAGQVVLLHVLELHLFHVDVVGTVPASVGLGQSAANPNPVPTALKQIVERYTTRSYDAVDRMSHPLAEQYRGRVGEQAIVTWVRGLAHFYPAHASRHRLLLTLLDGIHANSSTPATALRMYQLDLMCTRLALPDLAVSFTPVVSNHTSFKVDDAALLLTSKLVWSPAAIREGLNQDTCSIQAVVDLCHAVGGKDDGPKLAPSEQHSIEHVAELYQQLYDKQQARTHDSWSDLPLVVDALLRHIRLHPEEYDPSPPAAFGHAPLIHGARPTALLLLRSLQEGMLQCLHSLAAGGSGQSLSSPVSLEFDPARCAETLTLVDNNSSAKQHTAKQWGMVLSTYACAPNTGLHEWAVRLDRCEKGHVFLGVCTRDAAVSTYVGGDRQGWGLIGTRALWHNRSKVRGDYGDGFSTGSTVRIRLNTDTGALSFGLVDDDSDWGTAFDGLTQYGALYPAIGLYQRDDQVTLVPTFHHHPPSGPPSATLLRRSTHPVSLQKPPSSVSGASTSTTSSSLDQDVVFDTFVQYTHKVLDVERLSVPLLSALALMTPAWRVQFAWQLLPACVALTKRLDHDHMSLQVHIGGTWELKSSAAGTIPAQQYVVELTQQGNENDSSTNTLTGQSVSTNAVTLQGTIRGTKVRFLETWMQGSTCLVTGRVRVDGQKFTGTYQDTKSHTSGRITGECKSPKAAASVDMRAVLYLAASTLVGAYISSFLAHDTTPFLADLTGLQEAAEEDATSVSADASAEEYQEWVDSALFAGGLPLADIRRHLDDHHPPRCHRPMLAWFQAVWPPLPPTGSVDNQSPFLQELLSGRDGVDAYVTKHAGESAFVRLGGEAMKTAKRTVLAAMLWHGHVTAIDTSQPDSRPSENILHIWRSAHRVIEWGIRMKNANAMTYASVAALITRRARFLLRLQPSVRGLVLQERAFSEIVMLVSRFVEAGVQLQRLESMVLRNCSRAYLRMIGLNAMRAVVELGLQTSAGLCAVLQWVSNHDSLESLRPSGTGTSHYLDALGGVGSTLQRQVRDSWEQLYGHFAALLSRATWAKDSDLQLVVLQAWGIIIIPDDHAFISRMGIFRILQTVLDEARSSPVSSPCPLLADDNSNPTKPIVQAALKVVHLLAAQVATSSHAEESSTSTSTDVNTTIPLVRQPSGPETLGKSVFNMLYTELHNACQEDVGPQHYCYQICSLLHSVSGAAICRQHLSSGRWLGLLLQLVERGNDQIYY
ncbi:hypothetical protein B5M09_007285, partial [Aphanomyces astaci]